MQNTIKRMQNPKVLRQRFVRFPGNEKRYFE